MGGIALTIQGSALTSNMIVPSVRVNGYPIRTQYGRQDIPVPAGPVRVEVSAQWMRTYGQAAMAFTVQPGQLVPVFYAAPMHQFTTGMIGHEPQKRKGIGVFIGMLVAILLIVPLILLVPMILI